MVVKQANITSYKVSDPSEILDRRPVVIKNRFRYEKAADIEKFKIKVRDYLWESF